jgi:hypothetical protein
VVKVRIEIEQALNDLAQEHGLAPGPHGVGLILRELDRKGLLPDSATDLSRVMTAMNQGVEVDAAQAQEAIQVGNRFLAELRERRGDSPP